ncbi:glutamate receptor-interacting protein 1 isoform X1 [Lates japonicus]|uniref:Glutamate receptor-interacting protein 1 isoform X1 n=1 Tax=Lates japonicus TaxID=270547 RepID=A0AAD3M754_LATJO|nr:glutamate receptor-interacting protein 1 isoform X1 [Lates japonicus]
MCDLIQLSRKGWASSKTLLCRHRSQTWISLIRPGPVWVCVVMMERLLALLRLLSRRRRGRRYRADDDYQEGYEDVYYYTSKYNTHLLSE